MRLSSLQGDARLSDTMPRRILVAGLLVALWMWLGIALHLGVEAYLLAGVPLMAVFQRWIRRRPLWAAWIFDGGVLVLDARTLVLGMAAAAVPVVRLASTVAEGPPAAHGAVPWLLAAIAGGLAAGVALRAQRLAALRHALPTIVVTLVSFIFMFSLGALAAHRRLPLPPTPAALASALTQAVLYFDVSFMLEEVAFRGVLDPYLLGEDRGANAAWASAIVGSALWGLWHVPIVLAPGGADALALLRLVLFHVGLGAMLCFVARLSGTLVPSAAVHALGDAFRNLIS